MSDERKPLSKKDRRDAMILAAKLECGQLLVTREKAQIAEFMLRYENALQSVGYTDL